MSAAVSHFLLLAAWFTVCCAHYVLIQPRPYSGQQCHKPHCKNPCPYANSQNKKPVVTWKRGQKVTVRWQRNNHIGGYYRMSLVPVKHMFNFWWHKRTAFQWGCWTQGKYICRKRPVCGTDQKGLASSGPMTVPQIYPDGVYTFAMVWYGGLDYTGKSPKFDDYYTCSYVRIQGGPTKYSHYPTFVPGNEKGGGSKPGVCRSGKDFPGQCNGLVCKGKRVWEAPPGEFRNGNRPPNVLRKYVNI